MKNIRNADNDPHLARHDLETYLESHRQLPLDIVKRMDANDLAKMLQMQSQQGQIEIANQRLEDLERVVARRWNPQMKQWFIAFVIMLGAVTFSTGFQYLFKKQGSIFAAGGGALVGAGLTYLVDDRANKFVTKYRMRKDAENTLSSIDQLHRAHNPRTQIVDSYYKGEKSLVHQVEKDRLQSDSSFALQGAALATALEAGISFVVVLPVSGLGVALLGAALPVCVIWLAATFQSDRFEFADDCESLIPVYENYIPPSDLVTENEMLTVLKMNAAVIYVSGNGKSGFRSKRQAMAHTEAEFYSNRKEHYEQLGIAETTERHESHRLAVAALPTRFTMPAIDVRGLSPYEEAKEKEHVAAQHQDLIEAEILKLEDELEHDLEFIKADYGQKVNACKEKVLRAELELQDPAA